MDKSPLTRRKMRTVTVGALLALFVVAVLAALASRLLPGGLSGIVARKLRERRRFGEWRGLGERRGRFRAALALPRQSHSPRSLTRLHQPGSLD